MRPKELSDDKLVEFIESIFEWNQTGVLTNKDFSFMAEWQYPNIVFCSQKYSQDILVEGSRRYVLLKKQKQ